MFETEIICRSTNAKTRLARPLHNCVCNSCYYSWACRQSFFCLRLHSDEAYLSIHWKMTHKPRLHDKTADNCNNSHWLLSSEAFQDHINKQLKLSHQMMNTNWQQAEQLTLYKRNREVEPETTRSKWAGLEIGITGFQVRRLNTRPLYLFRSDSIDREFDGAAIACINARQIKVKLLNSIPAFFSNLVIFFFFSSTSEQVNAAFVLRSYSLTAMILLSCPTWSLEVVQVEITIEFVKKPCCR